MTQTQTQTAEAGDVTMLRESLVKLVKMAEPFAHCIYNDNGDVALSDTYRITLEQWTDLYFAHCQSVDALAASPAPRAPAAVPEELRETCAKLCEAEAAACIADIVPGDDLGAKLAHARASALVTAAGDIRTLAAAPAAPPADGGTEGLREAFRNVDAEDWRRLDDLLGYSGHGKFWRSVMAEVVDALKCQAIAARVSGSAPKVYPYSEPKAWPNWSCPDCRCKDFARVDEQKPDKSFGPGPLIRCVNCKSVFDTRTPAEAAGDPEGMQAIVAAYSRLTMAQAEALAALSPNGSTTIKVDAVMVALRAALAGLPSRTPAGAAGDLVGDITADDPTGWSKISRKAREASGLTQDKLAEIYNNWILSFPQDEQNPPQFKAFLVGVGLDRLASSAQATSAGEEKSLQSCPFCGGEASIAEGFGSHYVGCVTCGAQGSPTYNGADKAAQAWNSRTRALKMAEGCCSACSPCSHQKRNPHSICETCQKAAALATRPASSAPAASAGGEGASDDRERLLRVKQGWADHLPLEEGDYAWLCTMATRALKAETALPKGTPFAALAPAARPGAEGDADWRPIETAPVDGTEVPCLAPGYDGPVMLKFYKHNGLEAWRDWDQDTYEPTRWFKLPAARPAPSPAKGGNADAQ